MDAPKFLQLKAEEDVLEVLHASLAPQILKLTLMVIWLLLPFFFMFPLLREGTWGVSLLIVWILSGLIILARVYLKWSHTVLVVTDRRIVDHDQKGFFHRVVTEARYDQIDEVSYQVKGIASTLFRYGTLRVQLNGSAADIEVQFIKKPAKISDKINDLRSEVHGKE
jgi:hypothetical protein